MRFRVKRSHRKATIAAGCAFGIALVLAVLFHLFAVNVAESRLRSSLSSHASGVGVAVKASPPAKLLFGRADSVTIRIDTLRPAGQSGVGDLLSSAKHVNDLDVRIGRMFNHGLELNNVVLKKSGEQMRVTALLKRENVLPLLPVNLRLHGSEAQDALVFDATASAFGRSATVGLELQAKDGKIVIAPSTGIFSALNFDVYKDPRVSVDTLTTTPSGSGYLVELTAHLT